MWGLCRVCVRCVYITHLEVYLALRSKNAEKNEETEHCGNRETKKTKSKEAEKQAKEEN